MEDLHGRVALVTGGSRGIGRAIALRLAKAGADVAIGYRRNQEAADEVRSTIRELGRRATAIAADLGEPSEVSRLVDTVEQELGAIDILISNAAIGPQQTLEEITVEDWDAVIDQNLRAAFLLAQRIAPGMRERQWGRIVLVSSGAAFTGGIVGPHYATSKAGLLGLMHALAGPLARYGVTVNAVAPSLIVGGTTLPDDPALLERLAERSPMRRLGQPEEVAEAVLALISNAYITNQTLMVDGGRYPR